MIPIKTDICIIGGGSGGLSVAAGAVQMGARVVLFEGSKMGGDCLNYGCVPSKALLAAAKMAHHDPRSDQMGISISKTVNMAAVKTHIEDVIAGIAPHDSVERFSALGVKVIEAEGRFLDRRTVTGGGYAVKARYVVIATGSAPFVPPVPGLAETPHYTNETIFSLDQVPQHLIIMGGGPIGIEMAQAWRRLGADVSVVEAASILSKDEPELVDILRQRLKGEGINLIEGMAAASVTGKAGDIKVSLSPLRQNTSGTHVEADSEVDSITGSHLLVAVGRRPQLSGLDLEKAGIAFSPRGIETDRRLRTTNRRVFAIGDVAGRHQFTHMAGYHAGIVIRNMLFRLPARIDDRQVPWVTYADPELAHIGMTMAMAREAGYEPIALTASLADNDRARAEHRTEGMVHAVITKKGRILGASILAPHAGEMIGVWAVAMASGASIKTMASHIAPYPTYGEASKRAAGSFYIPKLFSPRIQRIVRFLFKWF
jgi:pyruvate/2-oxoglutarate dehydrogenase complex dihydrolipoamide dehydrogenase (E3) component